MLRNDTFRDLLLDAWAILPMEVLRALDFLLTAPRSLAGYLDVVRLLPRTLRERRRIRRRVRVKHGEVRRWLRRDPSRGKALARARLRLSRSEPP